MKPTVLILAGPTAAGKSDLAIILAQRFPIEIINADSLLFYRHMDIGTAKPTLEERESVPHHIIDICNPDEAISAAWYSSAARDRVLQILRRKQIPLLVGGAGFYFRAFEHPPETHTFEITAKPLPPEPYAWLQEKDPEAAKKIHPNDTYRISRAISLLQSGRTPSLLWEKARKTECPFTLHWLGLSPDRIELHKRIEERVHKIFSLGLVEETKQILESFPNARAKLQKTIGYREALKVIEKEWDVPTAIQKTVEKTRQYAKRQATWFRSETRIDWLDFPNAIQDAERKIELLGIR